MRQLLLIVLALVLSGCMKVSDLTAEAGYHLADVGLLNYSEIKRVNNFRLQADCSTYISQGLFIPLGHPSADHKYSGARGF